MNTLNDKRNYGIDLLRMVSMFMVILLHILGQGGVISSTTPNSLNFSIAWLIEISAFCAVNCFALISGFVMYNSKPDFKKAFSLWLKIAFYCILISTIMFIKKPELITMDNITNALFPISRTQYWYLSAYFGMYIISPVLNIAINNLDKKTLKTILLCIFTALIIFQYVSKGDPFKMTGGYSVLWLCILYLAGGYFAKYDTLSDIGKLFSISIYIFCINFTFLRFYFASHIKSQKLLLAFPNIKTVQYLSPCIVLSAIFLLAFFHNLKLNDVSKKIISFLAPSALSVYIIHVHPLIWTNYIKNFAVSYSQNAWYMMLIKILLTAVIIYIACTLVDLVRRFIFYVVSTK